MSEIETEGILDEIQALVCDKLQVVSYKWLSRNFLVSSNAAKRLLQDFVEKHGIGIEVVYGLSGWLKNNPSTYHIRLVSGPKLEEAKLEFDGNCSVQVYSVQACIPKDPAALWNAEFVQAEELFKQPATFDNCLLDNRFCGVSNLYVERNAGGAPVSVAAPQVTNKVSGLTKSNLAQKDANFAQTEQKKFQQSVQLSNASKEIKSESHGRAPESKPAPEKEKLPQVALNKKKGQPDRSSSGSGGVLANMWGRATTKPKSDSTSTETKSAEPNSAASAEAQICTREALEDGSSDDDLQQVHVKRTSNGEGSRKRRVVLDFSDDEDEYAEAVNLASPDPPKKQSALVSKQSVVMPKLEKNNLSFAEEKEDKPKVEEEKQYERRASPSLMKESSVPSNGKKTKSSTEKSLQHVPGNNAKIEDKATDAAHNSPKRRKVLKTRIDERGREVTEVVWEHEEMETKLDGDAGKKSVNNPVKNAGTRPPEIKKSPAMAGNVPSNQAGKAANKKPGNKDPKQGNILSFFKKK